MLVPHGVCPLSDSSTYSHWTRIFLSTVLAITHHFAKKRGSSKVHKTCNKNFRCARVSFEVDIHLNL